MFCLNGRVSEMIGRGWFSCSFVPVFPFGRTCPSHHLSPVGHGSPKGMGGVLGGTGGSSCTLDAAQFGSRVCKVQCTSVTAKVISPAAPFSLCQMDRRHFKPSQSSLVLWLCWCFFEAYLVEDIFKLDIIKCYCIHYLVTVIFCCRCFSGMRGRVVSRFSLVFKAGGQVFLCFQDFVLFLGVF